MRCPPILLTACEMGSKSFGKAFRHCFLEKEWICECCTGSKSADGAEVVLVLVELEEGLWEVAEGI